MRSTAPWAHPWPWICAVYCALLFVREVTLVAGSPFNSYPFMFSDSYDYFFEGQALAVRLQGIVPPEFPILRSPGYVLVQTLAHLTPRPEFVLFFVTNVFVWFFLMTPYFLTRIFGASQTALYAVGVLFLLNPSNELFAYILSDAQALSLMMLSTVCYLAHWQKKSETYLYLAALLALLGALTQTYAAIPLLVYLGLDTVVRFFKTPGPLVRRIGWKAIGIVIALASAYLLVRMAWTSAIPHKATPATFSLIQLNFSNIGFYLDTWGYLVVLYSPVLVVLALNFKAIRKTLVADPLIWRTGVIVVVFATLAFFYQWKDFRFTFTYLPLLFTIVLWLDRPAHRIARKMLVTTAVVHLLFLFVLSGGHPLDKSLQSIGVAPSSTPVFKMLRAQPMDRGQLEGRCGNLERICPDAEFTPRTRYQERVFNAMKQLHANLPEESQP